MPGRVVPGHFAINQCHRKQWVEDSQHAQTGFRDAQFPNA